MLEAVVGELAALLPGHAIGDIAQIDLHRFLLRFDTPPFLRVHVAIHPRLCTVHLIRGQKAPTVPTELAVALTRALAGSLAESVVTLPASAGVVFGFTGGFRLVVELGGRPRNLLLIDGAGLIVRSARRSEGPDDKSQPGLMWQPPSHAGKPDVTPAYLLERQSELEAAMGEARDGTLRILRSPPASGPLSFTLHAPAVAEELRPSVPLTTRNFFTFPIPLQRAGDLMRIPFPTANLAEEAATACMARHLEFASLHGALDAALRREERRLGALEAVLENELAGARRSTETSRRQGELLLAGLSMAQREGSVVRVPDLYDPEGGAAEIAIDPRLSLQENAARLFLKAKRAARAIDMIPPRLQGIGSKRAMLCEATLNTRDAASLDELLTIEGSCQERGLLRAIRRPARAEVAARPGYIPVQEYRSSDGFTIIVGRSSADNDYLTFKVASPHDLWLHAAGWPGAHVIVRNPRRLPELPERTLREAAALAGWRSKGREEKDLDVHYTFRKYVRKGKGMSPGMVMLRRHRTIRVAPGPLTATGPLD